MYHSRPSPPLPVSTPNSRRLIHSIHTALLPPLVFTSLLLSLWLYKSVILILLQNKIIYMPSMPPFSRSEKIGDYAKLCGRISWREERIASRDGVPLAVCVAEVAGSCGPEIWEEGRRRKKRRVVVIYLQGFVSFILGFSLSFVALYPLNPSPLPLINGTVLPNLTKDHHRNGSSSPPRLPSLSSILTLLTSSSPPSSPAYTFLALSYRGYWRSSGRPSQKGLTLDALSIISHAQITYPSTPEQETRFVLWGQSLGAGVAIAALAAEAEALKQQGTGSGQVDGVLLETPFTSVRDMLRELYPQKWLPYRYLGGILWNHWNSIEGLRRVGVCAWAPLGDPTATPSGRKGGITTLAANAVRLPKVLILSAEKDELVPAGHALELESLCRQLSMDVKRVVVKDALHSNVITKCTGKAAIIAFLKDIGHG